MSIAKVEVRLDEEHCRIVVIFTCPNCGQRAWGNYCSNCGKEVKELSKLDFINVHPMIAGAILKEKLDEIVEGIYRKCKEEGLSANEMRARMKERFDVPEKVKPRERR